MAEPSCRCAPDSLRVGAVLYCVVLSLLPWRRIELTKACVISCRARSSQTGMELLDVSAGYCAKVLLTAHAADGT